MRIKIFNPSPLPPCYTGWRDLVALLFIILILGLPLSYQTKKYLVVLIGIYGLLPHLNRETILLILVTTIAGIEAPFEYLATLNELNELNEKIEKHPISLFGLPFFISPYYYLFFLKFSIWITGLGCMSWPITTITLARLFDIILFKIRITHILARLISIILISPYIAIVFWVTTTKLEQIPQVRVLVNLQRYPIHMLYMRMIQADPSYVMNLTCYSRVGFTSEEALFGNVYLYPVNDHELAFQFELDYNNLAEYHLTYHGPLKLRGPQPDHCFASPMIQAQLPEILSNSTLQLNMFTPSFDPHKYDNDHRANVYD